MNIAASQILTYDYAMVGVLENKHLGKIGLLLELDGYQVL